MSLITEATDIFKITLPTPFAVGPVNVYLLRGDVLTLVDTGPRTEECWNAFTLSLDSIGYKPEDIGQIVLTHHHPDHVGMLDYFPKDITTYGHWRGDPWLRKDPVFSDHMNRFFDGFYKKMGATPNSSFSYFQEATVFSCSRGLTEVIAEGDQIPGLSGWTVLEMPGHAQSHITLYHEESGVMIGGDVLLDKISSNPIIEPPYPGEKERSLSLLQYTTTLKRLKELEVATLYSGHGEAVKDVDSLIEERLRKQKDRAKLVLHFLEERPQTAFDLCKQLFPKVYAKEFAFTMSETIGQLDYLESRGKIKIVTGEPAWIYKSTEKV